MNILLIGGTGGIGEGLSEYLKVENPFVLRYGSTFCDVTNISRIEQVFDTIHPDVIVYLAVKNIDGLIHKQDISSIDTQLNVNIKGFLNILRASNSYMRGNKFGRVIYISSVLSEKPMIGTGIYSATKAFGDNIVKTYALENAKYGITANSIQLGYFEGGLTDKVPEKILESVVQKIPAKRLGQSHELGSLVQLIINNEYINGSNILLTSGLENV